MNQICRQYQESLGESTLSDELLRHIETCEQCQEFVRRQEAIHRILPAWKTPDFSPDFTLEVMSRIAEENKKGKTLIATLSDLFHARLSIPLPVGALASFVLFLSISLNFALWSNQPDTVLYSGQTRTGNQNLTSVSPTTSPPSEVIQVDGDGTSQMFQGRFYVPQNLYGTGAFLLVPIIGPNLAPETDTNGNQYRTNSKDDI